MLLECTYEALEDAGMPKEKVAGANVGTFMASSLSDYNIEQMRDTASEPVYAAIGGHMCMLSNRISHHFDLWGVSLSFFSTALGVSIFSFFSYFNHAGSPATRSTRPARPACTHCTWQRKACRTASASLPSSGHVA